MADSTATGGKKNSALVPVLIVGMAVIVVLLGAVVFLLLNRESEPTQVVLEPSAPEQRTFVVNEDNLEEVANEIASEPPTAMGYYEVSMNFVWNFPNGMSPSSDAYVENVRQNRNNVYFDVLLAEDENVVLYQSPILPPGSHTNANEITLLQNLQAGSYPCVIVYHLVDDDQRTLSTVRMSMEIVVET